MSEALGSVIIVIVLAAAFVAYTYLKHQERRRRLEILHEERLAAMDKGIPLPELSLDPPPEVTQASDRRDILTHGIVWTALGLGGMIMLAAITPPARFAFPLWPLPLPLVLLGLGLVLLYVLLGRRAS